MANSDWLEFQISTAVMCAGLQIAEAERVPSLRQSWSVPGPPPMRYEIREVVCKAVRVQRGARAPSYINTQTYPPNVSGSNLAVTSLGTLPTVELVSEFELVIQRYLTPQGQSERPYDEQVIPVRLVRRLHGDVRFDADDQGRVASVSAASIYTVPGLNLPPDWDQASRDRLENIVGPELAMPFHVALVDFTAGSLPRGLAGGLMVHRIQNCCVATDPAGTRLGVRLSDYWPPTNSNHSEWIRFLEDGPADRLQPANPQASTVPISIAVSQAKIEAALTGQLTDSARAHADKLRITDGPSVDWAPTSDGKPSAKFSMTTDAIDACPAFGSDVSVDVDGDVTWTVAGLDWPGPAGHPEGGYKGPGLRAHTYYDWDVDDADVVKCALEMAVVGGIVGVALMVEGIGRADSAGDVAVSVLGGLQSLFYGPLGNFIGVIFAASTLTPGVSPKAANQRCVKTGKHGFDCETPADLQIPLSAATATVRSHPRWAAGLNDALVVGHELDGIPLATQAQPLLALSISGTFAWLPWLGDCAHIPNDIVQRIRNSPEQTLGATAVIDAENKGDGWLQIYGVELASPDPAGLVPQTSVATVGEDGSAQIKIHVDYNAKYLADPYPISLWVRSSGGDAGLELPRVPELDEDAVSLAASLAKAKQDSCTVSLDDWYQAGTFQPDWIVDPLRDPDPADYLGWGIVIQANPGEQFDLHADDDRRLTVIADRSGLAKVGLLTRRDERLTIRAADGQEMQGPRPLEIIQEEFIAVRAPLPSNGEVRSLAFTQEPGMASLTTVTSQGVQAWGAEAVENVTQLFEERLHGLHGATATGFGTLVWGDAGVWVIERTHRLSLLVATPVGAVAALPGGFAMTTKAGQIVTCRSDGSPIATYEVGGKPQLASCGGRLFALRGDQIWALSATDAGDPVRVESARELLGSDPLMPGTILLGTDRGVSALDANRQVRARYTFAPETWDRGGALAAQFVAGAVRLAWRRGPVRVVDPPDRAERLRATPS